MNKKYHNSTNDTEEMQCHFEAGILNLYSVYSASNVRRLCSLLCPAISFLQFHVLQVGPSISRPSFSRPAFPAPPFPVKFWGDVNHEGTILLEGLGVEWS